MSDLLKRVNVEVPKTLQECYQVDKNAKNIYDWAETIAGWGATFFYLIIFIGIIVAVMAGKSEINIDLYSRYNDDFSYLNFFSTLITWGIYAAIETILYKIIVLILSACASITQNTSVSARIALYNASKSENGK